MSTGREATWVVIPAYNEATIVGDIVRELLDLFENVVVVDDGSTDLSSEEALKAGAVVLRHAVNLGQGAALQTGIVYVLGQQADLIATFDADGQHQVSDIDELVAALRSAKADVALGSRFLGRTVSLPWAREIILKLAVVFTRLTTGLKVTDAHNGIRVLTANAARKLRIRQNRMGHASEIIHEIARLRLNYIEVPVTIVYSEYSLAKGQKSGNLVNILSELFLSRMQK